jgi:hypothetical protein
MIELARSHLGERNEEFVSYIHQGVLELRGEPLITNNAPAIHREGDSLMIRSAMTGHWASRRLDQ